ncbi:MAG TPA: molybdopterin molybdenumtransferase MoeA [Thiotrichales bacterium]|nr:molybdopterin molybdenumtransferase MoeA [Thiotrichales bacterium]
MTRDACGCDSHAPKGLLPVDEARRRIVDLVTPVTTRERVSIHEALGRILAEEVVSTIDVPPFPNSAMDGYAVRGEEVSGAGPHTLRVVGRSFAGAPFDGELGPGEAVRIMTGAPVPAGSDTVVMQERTRREGETVVIEGSHASGENVRHPGEDMSRGETVLEPGCELLPAHLGLLATIGLPEVWVWRRLRVAFFSTGDELKGVGEPLGPGEIHDSNRYTLFGMLRRLGVELVDMGVIPDERDAVRRAFAEAAACADVVITSGGVSVGEADFVKETLDELGEVEFWKVAVKPGKPLAVGRIGDAFFFGLPGNPVSVMATFYQFTRPALRQMMGAAPEPEILLQARSLDPIRHHPGRLEFQRGVLSRNEGGELVVRSTGLQGSHVLTSMARANCFIVIPAESGGIAAGEKVQVQPFAGLV